MARTIDAVKQVILDAISEASISKNPSDLGTLAKCLNHLLSYRRAAILTPD